MNEKNTHAHCTANAFNSYISFQNQFEYVFVFFCFFVSVFFENSMATIENSIISTSIYCQWKIYLARQKKYIHKVITARRRKKMNKITNIENIGIDSRSSSSSSEEDPSQFIHVYIFIYATSHFPNFIITRDASRFYCSRLLGLCCSFFSWHDQNGKFYLAASHFYIICFGISSSLRTTI